MGSQQSKVTSHDRAILEMKIQRDKLKQYQRRIQIVLDRETDVARECLRRGDKRRALLALRQKKYQQGLLEKTDDQLMTLEQLTGSIEFSLVEKDVLYGLNQGNKVLKDIHKELSVDKVERIMEDSAEALAYQEEISQMLGHNISHADEDDVRAEFEKLENEFATQFPNVPTSTLAPVERTDAIGENEQDDEEEEVQRRPQRTGAQLAQ